MKVALVHDFLNQYGGAERVLEVLGEMFPDAPIYTLIYEPQNLRGKFKNREIHASFFQRFPKFIRRRIRYFLPIIPTAVEAIDLRDFDLVISTSGAWMKGIVTRLNTIHIAYIHSPMRFVWDYGKSYLKDERKEKLGFIVKPILNYLRIWDKLASERPDYLIANSKYTQARINKYYRRDSVVIYPPVNMSVIASEAKQSREIATVATLPRNDNTKHFLIVSRLSAYKKIAQAIEAFNKLGLPLVIVGEGKEENRLKKTANDNIKFLGWQPDQNLPEIFAQARALVFPGIDDFGLAPVEAMAHGIPVIALKGGGAVEYVEEGKNGEFFESSAPEIIADGVRRFVENEGKYEREYIKRSVERFNRERFIRQFREFIDNVVKAKV